MFPFICKLNLGLSNMGGVKKAFQKIFFVKTLNGPELECYFQLSLL